MKRVFISLLLGLFSISAYSFDYHSIKSGMTKDEVQAILKCESETCKFGSDDEFKTLSSKMRGVYFTMNEFNRWEFWEIEESEYDVENGKKLAAEGQTKLFNLIENLNPNTRIKLIELEAFNINPEIFVELNESIQSEVLQLLSIDSIIKIIKRLESDNAIKILENLEKESLIDALIEGFNQAIKDADHVNENEMKSTAFNILPGMGK